MIDVTMTSMLISLCRNDPGDHGFHRPRIPSARLQRGLRVEELTLRFRVRQHVVAQLRPRSQPTRLTRLLGLGAVEVYAMPAVRALFGRASTVRSA